MAAFVACTFLLLGACQSREDRISEHFSSGQALLEQGDYVRAALEFRNVLQLDEDHVGALYGLARTSGEEREWGAMDNLLAKVIDLDPSHLEARIEYCRLRFLAGDGIKALQVCQEAEKLAADDARVLALEAAIYQKNGETERATEYADRAIAIDPANADAAIVLAAGHMAKGDPQAALASLKAGLEFDERNVGLQLFSIQILERLGDEAGAEDAFRKLISLYPDNRTFRAGLVRYLVTKKRMDAAEVELRAIAEAETDDIGAAMDVVRFLGATKSQDAAEAELRALVASRPDRPEFALSLADMLWGKDARDEARTIVQGVIDSDAPGTANLGKLQMARMLVADGDAEGAGRIVGEVLKGDARNIEGLIIRAALAAERKAYDAAISDLRTALNEQPGNARAKLALARVYELSGSVQLAEEQFLSAARTANFDPDVARPFVAFLMRKADAVRAEEILGRMLEVRPNDIMTLTQLAQLRLLRRDWRGAEEMAIRLTKLEADAGAAQQILGAALSGQKRYDESIDVLQHAQEADPASLQPLVALVNAYMAAGRAEDAMRFLEGIVEADPTRADAHVMIGSLLAHGGKADEAKARYRLAIEKDADSPIGYRALGTQLLGERSYPAALEAVNQGIAALPDDASLLLLSASIRESSGDIDGAIDVYRRLLELQPQSLVVSNNLASLLADHRSDPESLEEAYQLAQRFLTADVPQFKDTLAWIHYRRGAYDQAVALLRELVESDAPLPIYHYHLGMAYLEKGLSKLAREQLTQALKLAEGKPFSLAANAREALDSLGEPATQEN